MSFEMPQVPQGSGKHSIASVMISARHLAASSAFYSELFGWQLQNISDPWTTAVPPAGPHGFLRADLPDGAPGQIPCIGVAHVEETLARLVAAGGSIEQAPSSLPRVGKLALFKDPAGTLYGLSDAILPNAVPQIPMPIGANPKPPAGTICHLEMYVDDGDAAARFFGEVFGWGTLATMPQYMAFDCGAGVSGIFQSHTPTLPALGYIYTTDVDAKLAEIEAAGGKRTGEPMRMPGAGCFGYFEDPSKTHMGLIGP